jgi:hypothetical protein
MAAETWLTASEAVELGFADKIEKPVKIAAHFDLQARYGKAPADHRPEERQRVADITAACSIAKYPEKAAQFIAEGRFVRDVLAILTAQRAEATVVPLHNRPSVAAREAASWDKAIAEIEARAAAGLVIYR